MRFLPVQYSQILSAIAEAALYFGGGRQKRENEEAYVEEAYVEEAYVKEAYVASSGLF